MTHSGSIKTSNSGTGCRRVSRLGWRTQDYLLLSRRIKRRFAVTPSSCFRFSLASAKLRALIRSAAKAVSLTIDVTARITESASRDRSWNNGF